MPNPLKPITSSAAALSLDLPTHQGASVVMTKTDGWTVTLPAASGSGGKYRVVVGATIASSAGVIAALGTDILRGSIIVATDASGETFMTSATSDKLSMNGGTQGGLAGSYVDLEDIASGVWQVGGFLISTSTEATPFAAT